MSKRTDQPHTEDELLLILEEYDQQHHTRAEAWERIAQYCEGCDIMGTAEEETVNLSRLELEPVTVQLTRIKGTAFYLMPVKEDV